MGIVWWCLLSSLAAAPRPDPSLAPGEVIRTVVEALQNHDSPAPNAGILTVYQFSSPSNRAHTGPYGRFLRMVTGPAYTPLLMGHVISYGPLAVAGDRARQAVSFRMGQGEIVRFQFSLSRQTSEQTGGRCSGCWMVDQVSLVHPEP